VHADGPVPEKSAAMTGWTAATDHWRIEGSSITAEIAAGEKLGQPVATPWRRGSRGSIRRRPHDGRRRHPDRLTRSPDGDGTRHPRRIVRPMALPEQLLDLIEKNPRHRRDGLLAGRVILEPALDHRAAVGLEGVPAKDTVGRTTPRSASDKGRIRSRTILPAPE
jgi:hypothetical protein